MSFGSYLVVNDLKYKTTNRVGDQSEKRLTKTMTILSY